MSFCQNLQFLRHKQGLTQEQLSELLGVSRQAVSKWEAGAAYPEMDKLLAMCGLFSTDLNTLVHGDAVAAAAAGDDSAGYDKAFNRFSVLTALSIAGFVLAVAVYLLLRGLVSQSAALVALLALITLSLFFLIPTGIGIDDFKKRHPEMPLGLYSKPEIESFNRRFPYAVAAAIALIMLGVILVVGFYETMAGYLLYPLFLVFVAVGLFLLIYFGTQKEKYDIEKYNRENQLDAHQTQSPELIEKNRRKDDIIGRVSGAVMILATAVFLALGFLRGAWASAWVVFPVGGLLCGLVSVLVKGTGD